MPRKTRLGLFAILFLPSFLSAKTDEIPRQRATPKASPAIEKYGDNSGEQFIVEDEKEDEKSEDIFLPQIQQLFQNSAFMSTIERSADAINRSIDSLMDAIFYSQLDNELKYEASPSWWVSAQLNRQVYVATRGAYVVVDRFYYGPESLRELTRLNGIPVSLGTKDGVDIVDIYLRSDAERIAEEEFLPSWRVFANNLFGLVPWLSRVLPPSFNPNEMYDPIRQLETPFVFPADKAGFDKMPLGTVRSYSISGGIQLPIDLLGRLSEHWKKIIKGIGSELQAVYGLFIEGSHRVNILKKGHSTAWVGLSRTSEYGHGLNPGLGAMYFVLAGSLGALPWKGIPTPLYPLMVEVRESIISSFNQLYEFDLSKSKGLEAYVKAVQGDFVLAGKYAKLKNSGVIFHFSQTEDGVAKDSSTKNTTFVLSSSTQKTSKKTNVYIIDETGQHYALEAESTRVHDGWDILVGPEANKTNASFSLAVVKKKGEYVFLDVGGQKYYIHFRLDINDRYSNAMEYAEYIDLAKKFSRFPLANAPAIPLFNATDYEANMRRGLFIPPDRQSYYLHKGVQNVGHINIGAHVTIAADAVEKLAAIPQKKLMKSYLRLVGGLSEDKANSVLARLGEGFAAIPKLAISLPELHEMPIADGLRMCRAFKAILASTNPEDKRDAFFELFHATHPMNLLSLFYELGDISDMARKVQFFIKPSGKTAPEVSLALKNLSGLTLESDRKFPISARHAIAKEKLSAFYPSSLRDLRSTPKIGFVSIRPLSGTSDYFSGDPFEMRKKELFVSLLSSGLKPDEKIFLYLRLEETGKINIGKKILLQEVIEIEPSPAKGLRGTALDQVHYGLFLTGGQVVLKANGLSSLSDLEGEYRLSLAISRDGQAWGTEKAFRFSVAGSQVLPASEES